MNKRIKKSIKRKLRLNKKDLKSIINIIDLDLVLRLKINIQNKIIILEN